MPTERFFRLPDEKKIAIKEAAIQEFCKVPLENVSINKITQEAEISRGSFYTYFEDKRDIIRYILEQFAKELNEFAKQTLEENGGDIFEMTEKILERGIQKSKNTGSKQFMQNVIASACDIEIINDKTRQEVEDRKEKDMEFVYKWIYSQQEYVQEKRAVLHMLEAFVIQGLGMYIMGLKTQEETMKNFCLKASIVRKGLESICKENK